MDIFRRLFNKRESQETRLKNQIDAIKKHFKESIFYPDYVNLVFFYQYFYEILFKNYVWERYIQPLIKSETKKPIFLELGAYLSRNKELIPDEYRERYVISDINFEILEKNPQEFPKIVFDFQNIPIKKDNINFLIGINVLSHILGLGDIKEIKRIVEENGRCIFIEDLGLYAPGVSLFFENLNKRAFYLFDPTDYKIKTFIIEKEQFGKITKELDYFFEKEIDIERFIEQLKELNLENEPGVLRDQLVNSLEELTNLIKSKSYSENSIAFSAHLLDLSINLNSFLNVIKNTVPELEHILISFYNFLIFLRNIISNYSVKIISNWEDFVNTEEFKSKFKSLGLKIHYEFIEIESNKEELIKFQNNMRQKTDENLLIRNNPRWEDFVQTRNSLLNEFGLEIGVNGENFNLETGIIRYKALILTVEK